MHRNRKQSQRRVLGVFTYLFYPALAQNKFYMLFMILLIFWISTLINFFGMKASDLVSTIGVLIGTLVPGALIILLGVIWMFKGGPAITLHFSWHNLLADMSKVSNIVFLVGVLLGLSGMEMSAVHANEVKNPQRDYPRAIFISTALILLLSIAGSLAINMGMTNWLCNH